MFPVFSTWNLNDGQSNWQRWQSRDWKCSLGCLHGLKVNDGTMGWEEGLTLLMRAPTDLRTAFASTHS
jgi:hypothetical protein